MGRMAYVRGRILELTLLAMFMILLAIVFPWLALLLHGHLFRAAFCLGLQLSVIGWIPAAIWAVLIIKDDQAERRYRSIVSRARG
jgi:uncharacterized membrane protein YqaE (UPF0057 family)